MLEDGTPRPGQPRGLLEIQEMNRKGRISPLPQAVQGAQPQLSGPAGEPGIKSEFGRIFSGIRSGVGGLSSPVGPGAQLPYTTAGLAHREDSDSAPQDSTGDALSKTGRETGRQKRRKVKEEGGDESAGGRSTPVGRVKRPKTHAHHHHQYVLHFHLCAYPSSMRVC
jgi:hypothetical protein